MHKGSIGQLEIQKQLLQDILPQVLSNLLADLAKPDYFLYLEEKHRRAYQQRAYNSVSASQLARKIAQRIKTTVIKGKDPLCELQGEERSKP